MLTYADVWYIPGGKLQVGGSYLEHANASQSETEEEMKSKGEDIILAVAEVSSPEPVLLTKPLCC